MKSGAYHVGGDGTSELVVVEPQLSEGTQTAKHCIDPMLCMRETLCATCKQREDHEPGGIVPLSLLPLRLMSLMVVMAEMVAGMVPTRLLSDASKQANNNR